MQNTDTNILHEVRYLIEHRSDYLSADAVLENITRALDGEIFDPEVIRQVKLKQRTISRDPEAVLHDLRASLEAALGPEATEDQKAKMQQILEEASAQDAGSNTAQHDALGHTASLLGPAVLGVVVRFHLEARTSLSGVSELTTTPRGMECLGIATEDLRWPKKILHPFYVDSAAPEDPEIEARLAQAVETWKDEVAGR